MFLGVFCWIKRKAVLAAGIRPIFCRILIWGKVGNSFDALNSVDG